MSQNAMMKRVARGTNEPKQKKGKSAGTGLEIVWSNVIATENATDFPQMVV